MTSTYVTRHLRQAPGEGSGGDMAGPPPAIHSLVDRVRELRAEAQRSGQQPPGRPALMKKLEDIGATEHQIKMALRYLVDEPTSSTAGRDINESHGGVSSPVDPTTTSLESAGANRSRPPVRPWPLLVIGLAAAISVWSGWVGLGQLAGFGVIQPLPGLWDELRLNSAIVLPISVEAYAAYAMRCWLTSRLISHRARRFARWSTLISLLVGAGAQAAYHVMTAAGITRAPWPVTVVVATVPVLVLGLATALASLIGRPDGKSISGVGGGAEVESSDPRVHAEENDEAER
ncbi:hypothetical protein [Kibdelosporangium phytohabitans]|uniref:hypothetical protein n=1 Tax=Kibdelosporangium phytohabitans TaxID=860235 RepID=UPI0012FA37D4|nr:hypothetical protein [Kibdelosporangium phytohabitans]MBE1467586.1 hypothetical protein [Kibdelosporangium phytohabitans]